MRPDSTPRRSFGREFLENLCIQVGGALIQLLLFIVPAIIGYVAGDVIGLLIGLAVGGILVGLFWVLVFVLALGGIAQLLRGR